LAKSAKVTTQKLPPSKLSLDQLYHWRDEHHRLADTKHDPQWKAQHLMFANIYGTELKRRVGAKPKQWLKENRSR
jgi:hypothetical protein